MSDTEQEGTIISAERGGEFVQSLERGLAVIRCFSTETPALTLSEVSRMTGMTRAAARRFLLTLVELGYVRVEGRAFRLTSRVLELGFAYLSSVQLPHLAAPHLNALVDETNESAALSVFEDPEIIYLASIPSKRILNAHTPVGTRYPAYATSMGRVILCDLPEERLSDYFAKVELLGYTATTLTTEDAIRRELDSVRAHGYSINDQEFEQGLLGAAAPIKDVSGCVIAAVSIATHASRSSLYEVRTRILPVLLATARAIEAELASRSGLM